MDRSVPSSQPRSVYCPFYFLVPLLYLFSSVHYFLNTAFFLFLFFVLLYSSFFGIRMKNITVPPPGVGERRGKAGLVFLSSQNQACFTKGQGRGNAPPENSPDKPSEEQGTEEGLPHVLEAPPLLAAAACKPDQDS